MKCKFCGYDITDNDTKCPGCDKDVETLKNDGNIIYEENKKENVEGVLVGEAKNLKDLLNEEDVEEEHEEAFEAKEEQIEEAEEAFETSVEAVEEKVETTDSDITTEEVAPVEIKEKFKKKSGLKLFLIIIVMILLLAGAGYGYMYFIYTSPSKIVKKIYNALDIPKATTNTIELNYTNSNISDYNINSVNYISTGVTSDITISGIGTALNTSMYKDGDDIYLLDSNINEKYIKFDYSLISDFEYFKMLNIIINRNEIKQLISNINLLKIMGDSNYTKEYTTTTYDQKNMAATKVSYNNTKANNLVTNVLSAIRNNKDSLNSLSKLLNKSEDTIVSDINNRIADIANDNYQVSFDLYTDYLVKTYYKLDMTIKSNSHFYLVNISFVNNEISDIKITMDEKDIIINNDMTYITVSNGGEVTIYNYKYVNRQTSVPILDDALVYEEVKETVDAAVASNATLNKMANMVRGITVEDILSEDNTVNPDGTLNDVGTDINTSIEDTTVDSNIPETNNEEE